MQWRYIASVSNRELQEYSKIFLRKTYKTESLEDATISLSYKNMLPFSLNKFLEKSI